MQRYQGEAANNLLTEIKDLADGNNIKRSEIEELGRAFCECSIHATVTWSFNANIERRVVAGNGAISGRHFNFDQSQFKAAIEAQYKRAQYDREVRTPLLQRVDVADVHSLTWSHTSQPAYDFGEHSVCRHCRPCRGAGEVDCGGCHGDGKVRCWSCHGSGSESRPHNVTRWDGKRNVTHTEYRTEACGHCFGAGRKICSSCGGNGQVRCGECDGHGQFTDFAHVKCIAKPQWSVETKSDISPQDLRNFFQHAGPVSSASLLQFKQSLKGYAEEDTWSVAYHASSFVTELGFGAHKKEYTVDAIGNVPTIFVRPALFDDLLSSEITYVTKATASPAMLRRFGRKAPKVFHEYCKLPALDRAMKLIAEKSINAETALIRSTNGFISKEVVEKMSLALQTVLNKVSPRYSTTAWIATAILPATGIALFSGQLLEQTSGIIERGLSLVLMAVLGILIAFSVSPIAWIFSAVITSWQRRKVPVAYRQKPRNWAPKNRLYYGTTIFAVLGGIYGIACHDAGLPSLKQPYAAVQNWVESVASTFPLARPFVKPASLQLVNVDPPITAMSQADIAREIQRRLNAKGYKIGTPDGYLGTLTKKQMYRYMREHGVSNNASPREVLESLRLQQ